LGRQEAVEYFIRYFPWSNTERSHSGIDFVTPEQCPKGLRRIIIAQRKEKLNGQRYVRKWANRLHQNALTTNPVNLIVNQTQIFPCSVMIP